MPGLYINDGGASSSALSNALNGLAGAFSPEAQARASLLYLQSEQADWNNRLLSSQVPAAEQAAGSVSSLLSGANANPAGGPGVSGITGGDGASSVAGTVANMTSAAQGPNAGMNQGGSSASGVASTLSNASRPPAGPVRTMPRSVVNTAGYTPFAKYVANEVIAGRMPPEALDRAINLGQAMTIGPQHTYAEEALRGRPTAVSSGTIWHANPAADAAAAAAGGAGGGTLSGPSTYTSAGEEAGGKADNDMAYRDMQQGDDATANLGKAQSLEQLYDAVVAAGNVNPGDIALTQAGRRLSAATGINLAAFSSVEDVKKEIANRYLAMFGSLRDSQGNPLVRGGLPNVNAQFPDADSRPETFHRMSEALKASLTRQAANGEAAKQYFVDRPRFGDQAGVVYHQRQGDNARAEAEAQAKIGFDPTGGAGGSAGGGAGGAVYIYPDQATAEKAVAAGQLPKGSKVKIGGPNGQSFTVGD